MSAPAASRSEPAPMQALSRPRYAIYFAPAPESLLHQLGSSWLGRDASGAGVEVPGFAHLIGDVTREPRRYGFHATLKPPMALRDGRSEEELVAYVEAEALRIRPFTVALTLAQHHGFLALVPGRPSAELEALGALCVEAFDGFRKAADAAELERRRASGLSPRQERHLLTWGYPYVFEDFQFHMTLTRRLTPQETQIVLPLAKAHFAPAIAEPVKVSALSIFVEPAPGADFVMFHHAPLGGEAKVSTP